MDVKLLNPAPRPTPQTAYFCGWLLVDRLCSALLSGILHRPIYAVADDGDLPNSWELFLDDSPLSKEELHTLLNLLQADDREWDANDDGEYPVWGLSQSISEKLLTRAVQYPTNGIHFAEKGIWLTYDAPQPTHSPMYAISVVRRRSINGDIEVYASHFWVAHENLPNPTETACEALLRKAVNDFLKTEEGRAACEDTFGDFNWGDVDTYIPESFWANYGISISTPKDNEPVPCCGVIGILVDQDELLAPRSDNDGGVEQK